ncbi:unnamed protein product [Brassica napus]|uniref:(rape) hypothetical protein n=1 Tax=Brassica napus TaxID=3708 RepID=A0A816PW21_BRANA|nr:unnamed protein product [Brassica napus]
MRSTEKSPVVLYFKAISAESELLPSSSSCDLCCSPIPKYHHPPAYCLPVARVCNSVVITYTIIDPIAWLAKLKPTIRPGAAPMAPDMRVRLSQIEPDFLTRSVIFLYCLNHHGIHFVILSFSCDSFFAEINEGSK